MRFSIFTLLMVSCIGMFNSGCQQTQTWSSTRNHSITAPIQTVTHEEQTVELQPVGYEDKEQRTTLTNLFRRDKLHAIPLPRTDLNEELEPVERKISLDFNDF